MPPTARSSQSTQYGGGGNEHRHVVGTNTTTAKSTSLFVPRLKYDDFDLPSTNFSNDRASEDAVEQWLTSPVGNNKNSTTKLYSGGNYQRPATSGKGIHRDVSNDAVNSIEMLTSTLLMVGGNSYNNRQLLTSGQRLMRDRLLNSNPSSPPGDSRSISRVPIKKASQQEVLTPTHPQAPPRRNVDDEYNRRTVYDEKTIGKGQNAIKTMIGNAGTKPKVAKAFTFEDIDESDRSELVTIQGPSYNGNSSNNTSRSQKEGLHAVTTTSSSLSQSDIRLLRHHTIAPNDPSRSTSRRRNLKLETLTEDSTLEEQQQHQQHPMHRMPSPGMAAPPPPVKQFSSTPVLGDGVGHNSYSSPRRRGRPDWPTIAIVQRHTAGGHERGDNDRQKGNNNGGTYETSIHSDHIPSSTTPISPPRGTREGTLSSQEVFGERPNTTRTVSPSKATRAGQYISATTATSVNRRRIHTINNPNNNNKNNSLSSFPPSKDIYSDCTTTKSNDTKSNSTKEAIVCGGRSNVTTSRHKMKTLYQQQQQRKEEEQRHKRTIIGPASVPPSKSTRGFTVVGSRGGCTPSDCVAKISVDEKSYEDDDDDDYYYDCNDNSNDDGDSPQMKSSKNNICSSQLQRHPQPASTSSPHTIPGVTSQADTERIQNRSYGLGGKGSKSATVTSVPRSRSDKQHQEVDRKGRDVWTGKIQGPSSPLHVSDEEREKVEQHTRGGGDLSQTAEPRQQALVVTLPIKSPFTYLRGTNSELQSSASLRRTNAVKLHVYDLVAYDTQLDLWGCHFPLGQCFNALNSSLHSIGTGAYHVGVEVST
jgi:hypothetical protein